VRKSISADWTLIYKPPAWLTLATATTLTANLIVAKIARRAGVELSFREYLKSGVVTTLLSLTVGVLWLG
jgi:Na+/H+ antiporter NhaD/arsenite permease-like protein